MKNNHEFVHENMKKPKYVDLMQRLGALGDGNQDLSGFFLPVSLCFFFEIVARWNRFFFYPMLIYTWHLS